MPEMTDLTKLTAEELLAGYDRPRTPSESAEIHRRLERLEILELLYAASERLRQKQSEDEVKNLTAFNTQRERLEECAAALRHATTTKHDVRTCACVECKDARAALEGEMTIAEIQGDGFDPKCLELAEYFLPDQASDDLKAELAQHIQDQVEYWLQSQIMIRVALEVPMKEAPIDLHTIRRNIEE